MTDNQPDRQLSLTLAASELPSNMVQDKLLGTKPFVLLEVLQQDDDTVTVAVVAGGGSRIESAASLLKAVAGSLELPDFKRMWKQHQVDPNAN